MRSHAVVAPRGHVRPGASRDGLTHRETTAGAPVAGYAAVTLSRMRSADIHLDHHRGAPASGSNLSAGEPPANLSVARPLRRDGTSPLARSAQSNRTWRHTAGCPPRSDTNSTARVPRSMGKHSSNLVNASISPAPQQTPRRNQAAPVL